MKTRRSLFSLSGLVIALACATGAEAAPTPSCGAPGADRLSAPAPVLLEGALRRGASAGPAALRPARAYVLYFGAAWCGPCRVQVRAMKARYDAGDAERLGYEIVFVSRDESARAAAAYVVGEGMPWPYLAPGAARGRAAEALKLGGASLPDMVVVDAGGRILCRAYQPNGRYVGVSPLFQAMRRGLGAEDY